MRHRPEQCQTPRRRRGRLALPPGRLPVCGRNADLHTPPVSCSGYRSRCLGCMQTSVGAARRRRLAPSAQEPSGANRRRLGRRTRPDRVRGRSGDEHTGASDPPQAGRCSRCNQEMRLLTQRRSEPFTRQKGGGRCTAQPGIPAEKRGPRGRKTRKRFASPDPHATKTLAERKVRQLAQDLLFFSSNVLSIIPW